MSSIWTEAEESFRAEVIAFTQEQLPRAVRERVWEGMALEKEDFMCWQDALAKKGWLAGPWPEKFGGAGWTPFQSYIFKQESERLGAPPVIPFGITYVGPVIFTYGSEEQKRKFLPDIVNNKVFWSQGYSEPDAGSDLANVQMRAIRDGDHYVVNGSKIWTSFGHWSDWIFLLVRTSSEGKKQAGISFLLADMKTPGITIRPIHSMEGDHHFNQVFFDDVRVPVENLVGEENKGWSYAKFLLGFEHVRNNQVGLARRILARAGMVAQQRLPEGSRARILFEERHRKLEIDAEALDWLSIRYLEKTMGADAQGPEGSILKIRSTELVAKASELVLDVTGRQSVNYLLENELTLPGGAMHEFLYCRSPLIFAGANEVQRNMIARHLMQN